MYTCIYKSLRDHEGKYQSIWRIYIYIYTHICIHTYHVTICIICFYVDMYIYRRMNVSIRDHRGHYQSMQCMLRISIYIYTNIVLYTCI